MIRQGVVDSECGVCICVDVLVMALRAKTQHKTHH